MSDRDQSLDLDPPVGNGQQAADELR